MLFIESLCFKMLWHGCNNPTTQYMSAVFDTPCRNLALKIAAAHLQRLNSPSLPGDSFAIVTLKNVRRNYRQIGNLFAHAGHIDKL